MVKSDIDIQSKVLELSTDSLDAFCDDISGMFGVDMECTQQDSTIETVRGLKKRFKKLTAINSIRAKGSLHGTFYVVFDQGGLFTLSGVVVMLPENRIKEEIKRGSEKEAEHMSDAISELGNMMVGTWDRVFREELPDHEHFKQTNTFIGKPWENPAEVLGLEADEEFTFISYEVTVGSYPTFACGVIFPNAVFEPEAAAEPEPEAEPEAAAEPEPEPASEPEPKPEAEPEAEAAADEGAGEAEEAQAAENKVASESATESESPSESAETADSTESAEEVAPVEEEAEAESVEPAVEVAEEVAATEEVSEAQEPEERPVSRAIEEMTSSGSRVPGVSLSVTAEEIMQKEIIWVEESDTVQQVINRMQQNEVGYVMVGKDGVLEGIVSRSDVAGAVSPYLRPVFAKWKRPLDDATLQIKISWVMTNPVRTVTPHTQLDVLVETMLHFGGRCLPVVGADGKVCGMVTALDILKLLGAGGNVGQAGKVGQMPAVV